MSLRDRIHRQKERRPPHGKLGGRGQRVSLDTAAEYQRARNTLYERILDLDLSQFDPERDRKAFELTVENLVAQAIDEREFNLTGAEKNRLVRDLLEETLGVGPLWPLMADASVSDILVNGFEEVWVERFGSLEQSVVRFRDEAHLRRIIDRMVRRGGRHVDEGSPMADVRLPDGSRVNVVLPPLSTCGPLLSIRRYNRAIISLDDLLRLGSLSREIAAFLVDAVQARLNILISGGSGAGKTTLLNVLSEAIPASERIVTLEDVAELRIHHKHVISLQSRPANIEGRGEIGIRSLFINSLRMRPDRLIVGEVRGAEAFDMLQAMNTGNEGGLTTIHSNSPYDALSRLETMVLLAGEELPTRSIRQQIASALDLICHVERLDDGSRRLVAVAEVVGMQGEDIQTAEIFSFEQTGVQDGRVLGRYLATQESARTVLQKRRSSILAVPKTVRVHSEPQTQTSGPLRRDEMETITLEALESGRVGGVHEPTKDPLSATAPYAMLDSGTTQAVPRPSMDDTAALSPRITGQYPALEGEEPIQLGPDEPEAKVAYSSFNEELFETSSTDESGAYLPFGKRLQPAGSRSTSSPDTDRDDPTAVLRTARDEAPLDDTSGDEREELGFGQNDATQLMWPEDEERQKYGFSRNDQTQLIANGLDLGPPEETGEFPAISADEPGAADGEPSQDIEDEKPGRPT